MMRSRTIGLMLFGGLLLVLLLTVAVFSSQQARADPPVNGDWIINTPQTYKDKNFIVNGSVYIKFNGRLTLDNTSIRMNPAVTGVVQVEKNGGMLVRTGSQFTNMNGKSYSIVAFNQSTIEISNSTVYNAGWTWGTNGSTAGVFINTTNVVIDSSVFSWDYYGIIDNGRDFAVTNCKFQNITYSGLTVNKGSVDVRNSQFMWDRTGIRVTAGKVVGTNLTVVANDYGINALKSNITLTASKIKDNFYDMYAKNSTVMISNSTMWSDGYEFHLVNGTKLHLINTTFNDQAIAYDDNADQIDVWWFVRLHVTWQNGDPIPSANLTVKDLKGTLVYNNTVKPDGWSDVMALNEYILITGTGGGQTFYTPHNMTGDYKGITGTVFAGITGSNDIELKLVDNKAPILNITFPKGNIAVNHMPFNLNGTASDIGAGLKVIQVSAGSPNWAKANGTTKWNYTLNLTYDGVYLVQVQAIDLVGNSYTAGFFLTVDTVPPFLAIYGPLNNTLTNLTTVNVTGLIEAGDKVTVNGKNATISNQTWFWYLVVQLKEGDNNIKIVATDRVGNQRQATLLVVRDTIAPNLQVGTPSEGLVSAAENISVTGTTEMNARVTLNGLGVFNGNGQFSAVFRLKPGPNQLRIRSQDAAGNFRDVVVNVTFDSVPPPIALSSPDNGLVTASSYIIVRGLTEPGATVIVGGFPATNNNGSFERNLTLKDGLNVIIIKSTDAAGNENTATVNVTYKNGKPTLTIDSPTNNEQTSSANVTVRGTVIGAKYLYVNGIKVDIKKDNTYSFTVALSMGANPISVRAEDIVGNHEDKSVNIVRIAPKTTGGTKPIAQRLFDFNDPLGLIFLLALIIVIVGCVVAGVMAARAPPAQPSRPRGPPPEDRDGPPPYRGRGPPPRRGPPPPRRPGYDGGPPPRRPGYPTRPGGAYTGPAYSPEPEPPAPPVLPEPEPSPPAPIYAPEPEPMVEETPAPQPKVVEYEEPAPPPVEAAPEPGIPEIPKEEPAQGEHDQLEASIANILTTLGTKPEEPAAPEVVPMSLPLEVKDESPKTKDVLSEITCPNCHADIKSTWTTCPFCDYNLKTGGKPTTMAEQPKEPKKDEPEEIIPEEPTKDVPKEKAPLPTKTGEGDVKPIDLEEPSGRPLKGPAPEPKKAEPRPAPEPPKPEKPGKDGKNLDDILKKLKIS